MSNEFEKLSEADLKKGLELGRVAHEAEADALMLFTRHPAALLMDQHAQLYVRSMASYILLLAEQRRREKAAFEDSMKPKEEGSEDVQDNR